MFVEHRGVSTKAVSSAGEATLPDTALGIEVNEKRSSEDGEWQTESFDLAFLPGTATMSGHNSDRGSEQ